MASSGDSGGTVNFPRENSNRETFHVSSVFDSGREITKFKLIFPPIFIFPHCVGLLGFLFRTRFLSFRFPRWSYVFDSQSPKALKLRCARLVLSKENIFFDKWKIPQGFSKPRFHRVDCVSPACFLFAVWEAIETGNPVLLSFNFLQIPKEPNILFPSRHS
jgi:hypothetical protein